MQKCVNCTTTYSVGAPRCPHCGTPEFQLTTETDGKVYVLGDDGPELAAPPDGLVVLPKGKATDA